MAKTPATETDAEQRMPPRREPNGMPGGRAALRPGRLPKPYFGPQGDENRNPPSASPAPVTPAPVIEDTDCVQPMHRRTGDP
jgi:hypothetical protein